MFLLKCVSGFLALTPCEFPDIPFMTTPVGVSATSHFNASASVYEHTRMRRIRQHFFVRRLLSFCDIFQFRKIAKIKEQNNPDEHGVSANFCARCTNFSVAKGFVLGFFHRLFFLPTLSERIFATAVFLIVQIVVDPHLPADLDAVVFLEVAIEITAARV